MSRLCGDHLIGLVMNGKIEKNCDLGSDAMILGEMRDSDAVRGALALLLEHESVDIRVASLGALPGHLDRKLRLKARMMAMDDPSPLVRKVATGLLLVSSVADVSCDPPDSREMPYGPPDHHESCCSFLKGDLFCDCKASDASDTEHGRGS
jgi:hypothetical protein